MPLAQRHIPIRRFDIARIDRARQKIMDALIADFAVRQVFREGRLPLQEALHLNLRLESTRGITFERLLKG